MRRLPFVLFVSALIGSLSLGVFWSVGAQADSKRHFTLDVAMNNSSGVNISDVNFPKGTVAIADGTIYRGHTLPIGEADNTPNDPGGIGTWRCHFARLDLTDFPLIGAVTYFFQLEPAGRYSKESTLVAQGLNSHTSDFKDSVPRVLAVVGGTGKYAGATGEVREKVIGMNIDPDAPPGSRNLRFEFWLRGVRRGHDWDTNDD